MFITRSYFGQFYFKIETFTDKIKLQIPTSFNTLLLVVKTNISVYIYFET